MQRRSEVTDAGFRFGAVLILTTTVLLFTIAAPAGGLSSAVEVLLTGGTLLAVAVTSGAPVRTRRVSGALVALALIVSISLVGSGQLSRTAIFILSGVMAALALPALAAGLLRLLRARGVTVQAVTGALAIYLLIALVFAYAIGAVAEAGSKPYFAQTKDSSQSQRAYFSVTILTTTGLGDLTPATKGGRALTVVEELMGQLYLVTVVSLLVANVGRGPRQGRSGPPGP